MITQKMIDRVHADFHETTCIDRIRELALAFGDGLITEGEFFNLTRQPFLHLETLVGSEEAIELAATVVDAVLETNH